jgi:microcystin-dependent protein
MQCGFIAPIFRATYYAAATNRGTTTMADAFLGEVRMFAGNFAPVGWELCNGQLLPISQYDALFTLLGTTYGGDGQNTFRLPDLRGRTPVHQGVANGLTTRVIGQVTGTETVTLTPSQLPAHNHAVHATSGAGTSAVPTGASWAAASTGEDQYSQGTPNASMAAISTATAGGGQPHDNMAPFQALSFIIAVEGIYPSQA